MTGAMPSGSPVKLEYTSANHIEEDAVILAAGLVDCWWVNQFTIAP